MAVDAEPFLREPLHEAGRIGDFAAGFRERLALFGGHDRGEIVGMGDDQAVPFLENGTAIGGGARAPFGECRAGGIDRRRIGSASCRERVGRYGWISVVAVS